MVAMVTMLQLHFIFIRNKKINIITIFIIFAYLSLFAYIIIHISIQVEYVSLPETAVAGLLFCINLTR